jgi:hypothetical protein
LRTEAFIDGRFLPAADGRTFEDISPRASAAECADGAEALVTMLPAPPQVADGLLGCGSVIAGTYGDDAGEISAIRWYEERAGVELRVPRE